MSNNIDTDNFITVIMEPTAPRNSPANHLTSSCRMDEPNQFDETDELEDYKVGSSDWTPNNWEEQDYDYGDDDEDDDDAYFAKDENGDIIPIERYTTSEQIPKESTRIITAVRESEKLHQQEDNLETNDTESSEFLNEFVRSCNIANGYEQDEYDEQTEQDEQDEMQKVLISTSRYLNYTPGNNMDMPIIDTPDIIRAKHELAELKRPVLILPNQYEYLEKKSKENIIAEIEKLTYGGVHSIIDSKEDKLLYYTTLDTMNYMDNDTKDKVLLIKKTMFEKFNKQLSELTKQLINYDTLKKEYNVKKEEANNQYNIDLVAYKSEKKRLTNKLNNLLVEASKNRPKTAPKELTGDEIVHAFQLSCMYEYG